MDKVVDKVGKEIVVLIVTNNEASFKATKELFILKKAHLYWTPCVAHYIDLM